MSQRKYVSVKFNCNQLASKSIAINVFSGKGSQTLELGMVGGRGGWGVGESGGWGGVEDTDPFVRQPCQLVGLQSLDHLVEQSILLDAPSSPDQQTPQRHMDEPHNAPTIRDTHWP